MLGSRTVKDQTTALQSVKIGVVSVDTSNAAEGTRSDFPILWLVIAVVAVVFIGIFIKRKKRS